MIAAVVFPALALYWVYLSGLVSLEREIELIRAEVARLGCNLHRISRFCASATAAGIPSNEAARRLERKLRILYGRRP